MRWTPDERAERGAVLLWASARFSLPIAGELRSDTGAADTTALSGGASVAMADLQAEPGRRDHALRGILFMLAGGACFAVMDALVKWVSPRYPVMQIVFFRSLFA